MVPFDSTIFGKRVTTLMLRHRLVWGSATHARCPTLLGFPHHGAPSRRFALKAPGYGEDGMDRFLTWNLLFGLQDGTDYTPFLPAHVA